MNRNMNIHTIANTNTNKNAIMRSTCIGQSTCTCSSTCTEKNMNFDIIYVNMNMNMFMIRALSSTSQINVCLLPLINSNAAVQMAGKSSLISATAATTLNEDDRKELSLRMSHRADGMLKVNGHKVSHTGVQQVGLYT